MTWKAKPTGKLGRQPTCSDAAIQTCLTMKVLFGMVDIGAPLVRAKMSTRQTAGFVESLLQLSGLDWSVPDFSTLSRRQKNLAVNIPYRGSEGPLHLLIDNEALTVIGPRAMPNGIKVEGEGKWTMRKHGGTTRRGSDTGQQKRYPERGTT